MLISAKDVHPVDLRVGRRVRDRRKLLKISQTELAENTGVSFQQIQKYEKGVNRISASKLHDIAEFLGVQIDYFFAEMVTDDGPLRSKSLPAKNPSDIADERQELLTAFKAIQKGEHRQTVLMLAKTLADFS